MFLYSSLCTLQNVEMSLFNFFVVFFGSVCEVKRLLLIEMQSFFFAFMLACVSQTQNKQSSLTNHLFGDLLLKCTSAFMVSHFAKLFSTKGSRRCMVCQFCMLLDSRCAQLRILVIGCMCDPISASQISPDPEAEKRRYMDHRNASYQNSLYTCQLAATCKTIIPV